jgi:hypothetical protein
LVHIEIGPTSDVDKYQSLMSRHTPCNVRESADENETLQFKADALGTNELFAVYKISDTSLLKTQICEKWGCTRNNQQAVQRMQDYTKDLLLTDMPEEPNHTIHSPFYKLLKISRLIGTNKNGTNHCIEGHCVNNDYVPNPHSDLVNALPGLS